MQRLWISLALCCLAGVTWGQDAPALEESSVESAQIIQSQQKRADLWPMLQAHRVPDVEAGRHVTRIDDIDKQWLDADLDDPEAESIIGIEMPLDLEIDLADELFAWVDKRSDGGVGRFAVGQDGMGVWTTSLQVEGATALRLELSQFNLPEGVALYLYNDAEQAHGPYTGKGPHDSGRFWTHTVFGDHVWIQLHIDDMDTAKLERVQFEISQVGHLGERFGLAKRASDKADCSGNVDCVENAECYDWDDILGAARHAVARTIINAGNGYIARCTGTLMNDTDSSGQKPWFLTAKHCLKDRDITTLESFFQYKSSCGSCSASYVDSVLGSSLHMANTQGDYALLELPRLPSSGMLMGWHNGNVESQVGTNLYILSHPKGKPQSLSQHVVEANNSNKLIYARTVLGATEGGSSGAPVLNGNQQVVGVHKGVTTEIDLCDYSRYTNRAGALSYFWPSIAPFLQPDQALYSMYVSDVTASFQQLNFGFGVKLYVPKVTVKVVNYQGHGVPSVTVQGTSSGGMNVSFSLVTNADGVAELNFPFVSSSPLNFTYCVDDLTHDYYNNYNPGANTVTCASH